MRGKGRKEMIDTVKEKNVLKTFEEGDVIKGGRTANIAFKAAEGEVID